MREERTKSEIVEDIYQKNAILIISISKKFFKNADDQKDAVQGFFADKICSKSIEKVKEIQTAGHGYIYKAFQRYCIDIYRKQKKTREATELYIANIKNQPKPTVEITYSTISERMDKTLQGYRDKVALKLGRDYVIVFELIINGYKNPEIGHIMGKPTATIGTIKHRIKQLLI